MLNSAAQRTGQPDQSLYMPTVTCTLITTLVHVQHQMEAWIVDLLTVLFCVPADCSVSLNMDEQRASLKLRLMAVGMFAWYMLSS